MFYELMFDDLWLDLTNIVLAASAIICLYTIGRMLYQEIHTYRKIKLLFKRVPDDQTFIISGMGVTLEDGKKRTRNKTSLSSRGNLYVTEEGVIGRKRNTSDKKS